MFAYPYYKRHKDREGAIVAAPEPQRDVVAPFARLHSPSLSPQSPPPQLIDPYIMREQLV